MRRLLALLLLLLACEDRDPGRGSLGGRLVRVEDGESYGPAVVALYELGELRVVARQETDGSGGFSFDRLAPGAYTPVVYDAKRVMLHLERPRYRVFDGVHVELELPMAPIDAYPENGLYLEGRVVHELDDSPIPLALLEITAPTSASLELFSEIEGRSGPLTQLSDETGCFRLGPLPVLGLPNGDRMIPHLRISHPRFQDVARGPWAVEALPADLRIRMTRGEDPGWIGGQVLSYPDSLPVGNVPISLEWQAEEGRFPKLLPPELLARSAADGSFELANLPEGRHRILPGLLPDDGWVGFPRSITVAGSLVLEEALLVTTAIPLLFPADGATLDSLLSFEWGEHPAATAYQPSLQRLTDGARWTPGLLSEARWTPDQAAQQFAAPGGPFLWSVVAFDGLGRDISLAERPNLLEIRAPATQAAKNQ